MQLQQTRQPAVVQWAGQDSGLVAVAGQRITIETSPNGEEILDVVVPPGERWTFSIGVDIRVDYL